MLYKTQLFCKSKLLYSDLRIIYGDWNSKLNLNQYFEFIMEVKVAVSF